MDKEMVKDPAAEGDARFESLWNAVQEACRDAGIDEYEVYYSYGSDLSCRAFREEISGFSSGSGGNLLFRCMAHGKMGYASTGLLTEEEMRALPARAAENALVVEKDDAAVIYDGRGEYKVLPERRYELPAAALLRDTALECQKTVYALGEDVSDGTQCGAYASEHKIYLYNSKGLRLRSSGGGIGSYFQAMLERDGEKQAGYDSCCRIPKEEERKKCAEKAYARAAERFGAAPPPTGSYDLVIDEDCMEQFLSSFCGDFFAENCQKGLSPLKKEQVGEEIAAPCVTLVDTPFFEENPLQIAFDGEGVPTKEKKIIDGGKLRTLLYNLTSAAKDGVESTGNASRGGASIGTKIFTLYLQGGEKSKDELLQMANGGIFVTAMKGFHAGASAVTGDFSLDSEGFLIENGKKGRPLKSFTVSGNFFTLLKSIVEIANEHEEPHPGYSQIISPAVLVRGMSVAGE